MAGREDAEEVPLQQLLRNQLSPSARFEQVDFEEATEELQPVGYGSSGLLSRSQFLQKQSDQNQLQKETASLHGRLLHRNSKGAEATKRKRYGADPLFTGNAGSSEVIFENHATRLRQIPKDLEDGALRGRNSQPTGQTSRGGTASRKALARPAYEINCVIGLTPEDRARATTDKHNPRPAEEVFSERAPELLDLHSYLLNQRPKTLSPADTIVDDTGCEPRSSISKAQEKALSVNASKEIPEEEILRNRLSPDEIRQLPCGKFSAYSPGKPSQVIYIKNLSKDVIEEDLVVLFARYQKSQKYPLEFRLMKRGRMRGQAFITFSDTETSSKALQLLNGYILKGKPMVIEFGHRKASDMNADGD